MGPGDTRKYNMAVPLEAFEFEGCAKMFTYNTVAEYVVPALPGPRGQTCLGNQ